MPEGGPDAFGAWKAAELVETARQEAGSGADDGVPDEARFVANVAKLLWRRRARPDAAGDSESPAVFLLCPAPGALPGSGEPRRQPMLDNGLTAVTGRIWFVAAVVVSGRYLEVQLDDDGDLFSLVADIYGMAGVPAMIFNPREGTPVARFYANGLGEPDRYEPVPIGDPEVTVERVIDTVQIVYQQCLITPEAKAGPKLWSDAPKARPSSQAEMIIQGDLKTGLVIAFPTCTVRHEQTMPEGRLDLEVEQSDALDRSLVVRHVLLELKVLRSFRESGKSVPHSETMESIELGVKQAAAYRDSKGVRNAILCCFDMRVRDTGNTCFEHVKELAEQLKVMLKRWFLYSQSRFLRDALAADSS